MPARFASFLTKLGLAVVSFATLALFLSWQFSALMMVIIFTHEYGHVWAMRRCGLKNKGFYFVPFLGGAAVPSEPFTSRWTDSFVSIMGPIWGLLTALAFAGLYLATANPWWAVAATWGALINLFNLLPVYPLDGGRIFKTIALSVRPRLGWVIMIGGLLLSLLLTAGTTIDLFIFILTILFAHQWMNELKWRADKNYKVNLEIIKAEIEKDILDTKRFLEIIMDNLKMGAFELAPNQVRELAEVCRSQIDKSQKKLRQIEADQNMAPMTGVQIFRSVCLYAITTIALMLVILHMIGLPSTMEALTAINR